MLEDAESKFDVDGARKSEQPFDAKHGGAVSAHARERGFLKWLDAPPASSTVSSSAG